MYREIAENFLRESVAAFESYKKMAEKSFKQVRDEEFFKTIDAEANSVGSVAKHVGGNLRSRWSEFLTTDGEKADRDRDSEFVTSGDTRESVLELWEAGWQILLDALKSLTAEDLNQTVKIRGEDLSVVKAVNRALAHTAYHIGQIVLLAKHFRSSEWKTLSIPKNKSEEFREFMSNLKDKGNYLETAREFADNQST